MAIARRALRYWWLVVIITVLGGTISVLLALSTPRRYISEARLLYNERINSSLLHGRDAVYRTNNLGTRYGEVLRARRLLAKVIIKHGLFPEVVAEEGMDAAVAELKQRVVFRSHGTGMFYIRFTGPDPHLSQSVTRMLTDLMLEEDHRLRRDSASTTKRFLLGEKARMSQELGDHTQALAAFLVEHPEFAMELLPGQQSAAGAGVRAAVHDKAAGEGKLKEPRLLALERQRRRLRARLGGFGEAPDAPLPATPEAREAAAAVRRAKGDVQEAERRLTSLRERFTAAHPDVMRAGARLRDAEQRLVRAEAAIPPPSSESPPAPEQRKALQRELADVEHQIAEMEARSRRARSIRGVLPALATSAGAEHWAVALETEFFRLSQLVSETRRRVNTIDTSLAKAELADSQQMAEEAGFLTVIDPANLPSRPAGRGRSVIAAAGLCIFTMLGLGLAVGLALVDDRIYTASDLRQIGVAPTMAVIVKPPIGQCGPHG